MPSDHFKSLPLLKVCSSTILAVTSPWYHLPWRVRPLKSLWVFLLFDSFYWPKNWQGIWRTGTEKVSVVGCFLYPAELMAAKKKKKKTTGFPNKKRHQADFSGDSGRHIHSNDQQLEESELWESDDGEEVRSPQLKQILNSESQKQRGENLRTFNQQTQGSLAYRSQPSRVCI